MYRAIIADDEPKVALLIQNLIQWDALGLELVGTAGDGPAALALVNECRPDIVITDIRMPGYDGIEFIGRAKALSPYTNFLIVSGYRHFDYAQSAIRFGVEDYLLKPLKASEINETLARIIKKCHSRESGLRESGADSEQAEQDLKSRRQAFVESSLRHRPSIPYEQAEAGTGSKDGAISLFGLNQEGPLFQAFAIKADVRRETGNENSYQVLLQKCINSLVKWITGCCADFFVCFTEGIVFCIANLHEAQRKALRKAMVGLVEDLQSYSELFPRIRVTVGVGQVVDSTTDIPASIRSAGAAMANRLVLGTGRVIDAPMVSGVEASADSVLTPAVRSRIMAKVEVLDGDGLAHVIGEIANVTVGQPGLSGMLVTAVFQECVQIVRFALKQHRLPQEWMEESETGVHMEFRMASTTYEVFKLLEEYVTGLMVRAKLLKSSEDNKPIREAKTYIQSHFSEHMSLERLSELVGLNPTYLSVLFKKETGMNFLDYVAEVRVREAKRLLSDARKTVSEISESVGYADVKHFSKVFTRVTGLHPSEYRKLYY